MNISMFNYPFSIKELPAAAHWVMQRITQVRRHAAAYQRLAVALDAVPAELVIAEEWVRRLL
jgi:hypothetical protein